MRYTIWSRGRPIGATDLAFRCPTAGTRGGWFYPNRDGKRLMPVVGAVLTALRACRGGGHAAEPETAQLPDLPGSSALADLREADHHVAALDLELRDACGARVPTAWIGIQDTHALLELAHECSARHSSGDDRRHGDDPVASPAADGCALDHDGVGDDVRPLWRDADDGVGQCWFDPAPGEGCSGVDRVERYQVFLALVDMRGTP